MLHMLDTKNLLWIRSGGNLDYLYTLNSIGSSLNNNKHIEATLFTVAKALLCKIKLLFKKKQWVKNDLSVSSPSNNTNAGPATVHAQAENGAPFYPRDWG